MPVAPGTYDYYVAAWELNTIIYPIVDPETDVEMSEQMWQAPAGSVGALDIGRTDKSAGIAPGGVCFCWLPAGSPAPAAGQYYGDDINGTLNNGQKNQICGALDLPNGSIQADSVVDILWEVLTVHADVAGLVRAKPLVPTVEGDLELRLQGHSPVKVEPFQWGAHSHTAKLRELLQREWSQIKARQAVWPDRLPQADLGRSLDWQREKYARMGLTDYRELLPPQFRDVDVPIPHQTTIADGFEGSSGDPDLDSWTGDGGGVTSWTNLEVPNSVQVRDSDGHARNYKNAGSVPLYQANPTLSGTDHYSEANTTIAGSESGQTAGTLARLDGTDSDDYYQTRFNPAANAIYLMYRSGGGTVTEITNVTPTTTAADGLLIRLECNGSSIKVIYDGNTDIDTTDTNVTSGNYTGIYGNTNSSVRDPDWDNYEAGDLGAGDTSDVEGLAARNRVGQQHFVPGILPVGT